MNKQPLSEKEFEIINILADGMRTNQRELSTHIGISLGMTNLLLRRLAVKGYLRIKQLDAKKVQYMLTPRGLAEKARKSYHYTQKTVQSFGLIREGIQTILQKHLSPKTRHIIVVGHGDLADLTHMMLGDLLPDERCKISRMPTHPTTITNETVVINASAEPANDDLDLPGRIQLFTDLAEKLNPQINHLRRTYGN